MAPHTEEQAPAPSPPRGHPDPHPDPHPWARGFAQYARPRAEHVPSLGRGFLRFAPVGCGCAENRALRAERPNSNHRGEAAALQADPGPG